MTNFTTQSDAKSEELIRAFIYGALWVEGFGPDNEIQIEIGGEYSNSVFLDRAKVIELRDWLTEQIEASK